MKFIPAKERLLVKRDEPLTRTPGGIYVPTNNQEQPTTGKLMSCSEGSPYFGYLSRTVVFGKYAGAEIKVDEEDFLVIREEDVIGVLLPD